MTKAEAWDAISAMFLNMRCMDHGCIYGHPGGMGTNGGCRSLKARYDMLGDLHKIARTWRELTKEIKDE